MIFLPRHAAALAAMTAADGRYAMSFVRVRELPGSNYRVEATDGRVLAILRGSSAPHAADLAAARRLPAPDSLLAEALVPAAEFKAAFRELPAGRAGDGRTVGVLLGHPVVLSAGRSVATVTPGAGRFPDVDSAVPRRPALISVRLNPELLVELLRVAAVVAKTIDGVPTVELLYWGEGKPVGVTATGAGGVAVDGLVMPLT